MKSLVPLVFVKYFFITLSILGLIITISSTYFGSGSNDYTIQQKLIKTAIFLVFGTLGPFLLYKFLKFMNR